MRRGESEGHILAQDFLRKRAPRCHLMAISVSVDERINTSLDESV